MIQRWFILWTTACLHLLATVALAGVSDAASSSDEACTYAIAYSAPASCPDISSIEPRLDANYRLRRGTLADCKECVHGIVIEPATDENRYQLRIAGLESTTVLRNDCNELVDFALYAIEASDLPPPVCTKTSALVGVSATPLLNVENRDPLLAAQVRLTISAGPVEFTPFGVWLPESEVSNQVVRDGRSLNPDWATLSVKGYGAGLDACYPLVNGLLGRSDVLSVCGVGVWRRFTAKPRVGNAALEAELWTLGVAASWRVGLFDSLHLELAPTVLMGLGDAATYAAGSGEELYQYGGLEAQLRVGLAWEFWAHQTRHTADPVRNALSSSSPRTVAYTSRVSRM